MYPKDDAFVITRTLRRTDAERDGWTTQRHLTKLMDIVGSFRERLPFAALTVLTWNTGKMGKVSRLCSALCWAGLFITYSIDSPLMIVAAVRKYSQGIVLRDYILWVSLAIDLLKAVFLITVRLRSNELRQQLLWMRRANRRKDGFDQVDSISKLTEGVTSLFFVTVLLYPWILTATSTIHDEPCRLSMLRINFSTERGFTRGVCSLFWYTLAWISCSVWYIMFCIYYTSLCNEICRLISRLKAKAEISTDVREILDEYKTVTRYFDRAENLLNFPVVLYVVLLCIGVFFMAAFVLGIVVSCGSTSLCLLFYTDSIGSAVILVISTLLAAEVSERGRSLDLLLKSRCLDSPEWLSFKEVNTLEKACEMNDFTFTGWKMFSLRRGFLLAVAGTVVTYSLLFLQIKL